MCTLARPYRVVLCGPGGFWSTHYNNIVYQYLDLHLDYTCIQLLSVRRSIFRWRNQGSSHYTKLFASNFPIFEEPQKVGVLRHCRCASDPWQQLCDIFKWVHVVGCCTLTSIDRQILEELKCKCRTWFLKWLQKWRCASTKIPVSLEILDVCIHINHVSWLASTPWTNKYYGHHMHGSSSIEIYSVLHSKYSHSHRK